MGHSDEEEKNTTQESLVKECGLPCTSNINNIEGTRRMRLFLPISNVYLKLQEQRGKAGEHWSLLICDIQASANGIEVQFGHFDSFQNSGNLDVSDVVAGKIHEVSFLSYILVMVCTNFTDRNIFVS